MSDAGTNAPDFSILITRLRAGGQWERVWDYSRQWLAVEPENLHAHWAAGQAAVQLDRYVEARPHIERVLAGQPENDLALRLLSIIQFHADEFAAADETVRRAIALDPNDPHHWWHLGWMCYVLNELPVARDCLKKAHDLSPNDADILNLLAMCEPDSPEKAARKQARYLKALELDPENAEVHNNLGAYYLESAQDFAAAENSFRTALSLNPLMEVARTNLFVALKKRDVIYRVLHAPQDLLLDVICYFRLVHTTNVGLYIFRFLLWLTAAWYAISFMVFWYIFFWPLVKVYESLTLGDIRAKAGELGARKGGVMGHHRWPLSIRLGIFAGFLGAFWAGTGYCAWRWPEKFGRTLASGIIIAILAFCAHRSLYLTRISWLVGWGRRRSQTPQQHSTDTPTKKPRWNFSRGKSPSHD